MHVVSNIWQDFLARIQQKYTQRGGRRPFGISTLLVGQDADGSPHLYQTDPSGTYSEWTANAIGRNSKTVVEFLEKHHNNPETTNEKAAVRLAITALLEVVESGAKNIEVGVMRRSTGIEMLEQEDVDNLSKEISDEKEKDKQKNEKKEE